MNYRPKPTQLLSYKLMIFEKRSNNSQIDYLTSKNIFELSLYCFFSRCMVVTSVTLPIYSGMGIPLPSGEVR